MTDTKATPENIFMPRPRGYPFGALRRNRVHALYTRLTKDGVEAWLDKEKLLPGQD